MSEWLQRAKDKLDFDVEQHHADFRARMAATIIERPQKPAKAAKTSAASVAPGPPWAQPALATILEKPSLQSDEDDEADSNKSRGSDEDRKADAERTEDNRNADSKKPEAWDEYRKDDSKKPEEWAEFRKADSAQPEADWDDKAWDDASWVQGGSWWQNSGGLRSQFLFFYDKAVIFIS